MRQETSCRIGVIERKENNQNENHSHPLGIIASISTFEMSTEEKTVAKKEGGNGSQQKKNGNGKGLEEFLTEVLTDLPTVEKYRSQLHKVGIKDVARLQQQASILFLTSVCKIPNDHAKKIMQSLFAEVGRAVPSHFKSYQKGSLLTRENIIILKGIGHGAVGRDYCALFAPNLKLVVIKCIETKDPIKQQVVVKQLTSTYSVSFARCQLTNINPSINLSTCTLSTNSCSQLTHTLNTSYRKLL